MLSTTLLKGDTDRLKACIDEAAVRELSQLLSSSYIEGVCPLVLFCAEAGQILREFPSSFPRRQYPSCVEPLG